jgi:hypothetical protein
MNFFRGALESILPDFEFLYVIDTTTGTILPKLIALQQKYPSLKPIILKYIKYYPYELLSTSYNNSPINLLLRYKNIDIDIFNALLNATKPSYHPPEYFTELLKVLFSNNYKGEHLLYIVQALVAKGITFYTDTHMEILDILCRVEYPIEIMYILIGGFGNWDTLLWNHIFSLISNLSIFKIVVENMLLDHDHSYLNVKYILNICKEPRVLNAIMCGCDLRTIEKLCKLGVNFIPFNLQGVPIENATRVLKNINKSVNMRIDYYIQHPLADIETIDYLYSNKYIHVDNYVKELYYSGDLSPEITKIIKKYVGDTPTLATLGTVPTCVICFTNVANILVTPCNHLAYCSMCLTDLKTCPCCRATVKSYCQVFF